MIPNFARRDQKLIYFIQEPMGLAIKIGSTDNPRLRFDALQAANAHELALLGVIGGGTKREFQLHETFAKCRLRGEWFSKEIHADVTAILLAESLPDTTTELANADDILTKYIGLLSVGTRCRKMFDRMNINTIGDLVQLSPQELVKSSRNFGFSSVERIEIELAKFGLKLKAHEKYQRYA